MTRSYKLDAQWTKEFRWGVAYKIPSSYPFALFLTRADAEVFMEALHEALEPNTFEIVRVEHEEES
jgi:hypothetical protein